MSSYMLQRLRAFGQTHSTELLLSLAALALYLPGILWGLPYANDPLRIHGWATDALTPLEPLSQVYGLFNPQPDRWLPYPLMHSFVLTTVYSPYLAYLLVTGQMANPTAVYPFGLADPVGALQVLELIGRGVSILMAIGVIIAMYHIGKTMWDRRTGLLASVFTMLLYPMFYYSRTGNADVPVLFWTMLGIAVFAKILMEGLTVHRAAWIGIFAGFAIATKDQGWGAFVLLPPMLLLLHSRNAKHSGIPISWKPLMVGFVASVFAYSLGSGLAISPERHFAHIQWVRDHVPFPMQEHFPATLAGYGGLLKQVLGHLSDSSGPILLIMALAGVGYILRREPFKFAILIPAIGHFVCVLAITRMSLLRYVIPIAVILCLPAARLLAAGLVSSRGVRAASAVCILAICGWMTIVGADLTYQQWYSSHYPAAEWLAEHAREGDTVGTLVATACLPELKDGIQYYQVPRDETAAAGIASNSPEFVVVMPDWTSVPGTPYPRVIPEAAYEALADGSLGYRLAARFRTPALVKRQILDYPTVNPPIEIYAKSMNSFSLASGDRSPATQTRKKP